MRYNGTRGGDSATALEQGIVMGYGMTWFRIFVHSITLNTGITSNCKNTYPATTIEIRMM
jgi:hypothetical protein